MIQVTQGDMEKLRRLIEARRNTRTLDQDNLAMLAQELERAEIVPPANISMDAVTMHSRVLVRDLKRHRIQLHTRLSAGCRHRAEQDLDPRTDRYCTARIPRGRPN